MGNNYALQICEVCTRCRFSTEHKMGLPYVVYKCDKGKDYLDGCELWEETNSSIMDRIENKVW